MLSRNIVENFRKKDAKYIEKVVDLYSKRGVALSKIDSWRHENEETLQEPGFANEWNVRVQELQEIDRELMHCASEVKDDVERRLRELMKRKYLLIYSKEPKL